MTVVADLTRFRSTRSSDQLPPLEAPRGTLRVLVIHDEAMIQRDVDAGLSPLGHDVIRANGFEHARVVLERLPVDLVLIGLFLNGESSLRLIPEILTVDPAVPVALMTETGGIGSAVEAIRQGAFDYLTTPIAEPELRALVARVITRQSHRLAPPIAGSGTSPAPLLASSHPGMTRALQVAYEVAQLDATVLITGETGTGKGVLARAIHQWSPRANGPYAMVNCPALSAELLRSELFGHVRGSFTGAVGTKVGTIEYADGGTLFLDEIGEMAPEIQPRLLCFLQDLTYERVGDPEPRQADVRVVAATNGDLGRAVTNGRFRDDLYHRLNVVPIELVPLRSRRDDIPALANAFLQWAAARYRKPVEAFTEDAMDSLIRQPWRGNIRELQHVVERAVILARGSRIPVSLLPRSGRDVLDAIGGTGTDGDRPTLKGLEERYIRHVLETTTSIEQAAEVLGVAPSTLWRRRRRLGI